MKKKTTNWIKLESLIALFTISLVSLLVLTASIVPPSDETEQVRAYTRNQEFDYIAWTLNALGIKINQAALGLPRYMDDAQASQVVRDYLALVGEVQSLERQVAEIYANPEVADPLSVSAAVRAELEQKQAQKNQLGPLAESILQNQVASILKELGLTTGGQPMPPVLYHNTPVPMALIVSPRTAILQQNNISLQPEMSLDEQVALEESVAKTMNVSALVVPIGGVGTYPTMVYQTTNLNWLAEVVAHEWIHNYLTPRPLGMNYLTSGELRTINETTANLAGKEIGSAVIARYYPELVPPPPPPPQPTPEAQPETAPEPPPPPVFSFQAEMRTTRVRVDELLAAGQVEEAEAYMEARRQFFWTHGYRIRKLNQAYFAFYGAYADVPGGAAGTDPVGKAVRNLRAQSSSLAEFIQKISWVTSFEQLQNLVEEN